MKRPKWLSGWGKGKNLLEAKMLIDTADINVVEASYNNKLLFFAIGAPRENEKTIVAIEGNKTEMGTTRYLNWKIFYDATVLPQNIPLEKAKNLMAGIISASAKTMSVYEPDTIFVASSDRPSKGNSPLLTDYEIAAKIEAAKKEK